LKEIKIKKLSCRINILNNKAIKLIDLFNNYINSEFNKINILKQGVLTPCIDKKFRLSNISNINNAGRKMKEWKNLDYWEKN